MNSKISRSVSQGNILKRRGHSPNHRRRKDPDPGRQAAGAARTSLHFSEGGEQPRWKGGTSSAGSQIQIECRAACG
jgi:hypothetical protein